MFVDDLLPELLVDVPGCPDITAQQAILNAAIEWCYRTLAWNEFQSKLPLIDGIPLYDVDKPAEADIAVVMNVWVGDSERPVHAVSQEELMRLLPNWHDATAPEPSYFNAVDGGNSIRVFPTPKGTSSSLSMRVAFQPKRGAKTLPDLLAGRHTEKLLSGAKARLMLQPGRAWANPELGVYHRSEFEKGIFNAHAEQVNSGIISTTTVKSRGFGY